MWFQMPFTPFHLGPALFLGLLLFRLVDFPTLLVASVILDLEPLSVLTLGLDYPLHGFFHTFLGGTIVAAALGLVMFRLSGIAREALRFFALEQSSSHRAIMLASFLGVYSHVLLDSPLYADIMPFFPFSANPFFAGDTFAGIYVSALCILLFLLGIVAYGARLIVRARGKSSDSIEEADSLVRSPVTAQRELIVSRRSTIAALHELSCLRSRTVMIIMEATTSSAVVALKRSFSP